MIVASVLVTVAFLFALRALLMGVTYVALSYRYFLRPHKFGLPSGWYLLWFESTPAAIFLFITAIVSASGLFLTATIARLLFENVGLSTVVFLSGSLGVGSGVLAHRILFLWSSIHIAEKCNALNVTVDDLMAYYVCRFEVPKLVGLGSNFKMPHH